MEGIRLCKYSDELKNIEIQLATLSDREQIRVLHEMLDDTPFKTQNYNKYQHDEYDIRHNRLGILKSGKKTIPLILSDDFPVCNFIDLIAQRSSLRDYANQEVSFEQFSALLHYSMGTKRIARGAYNQREYPFRFCNSAGGLNHLDLYLLINRVESIESGVYYYDFINDSLIQMDYGNMRSVISRVNFQNEFSVYSNFVAVIVSDLSRIEPKYYKRSYRMAHVDGGIAMAHMQVLGEYLGLSSCIIAGFLEHELENLLHLTEDDYPICTMSFGVKNR